MMNTPVELREYSRKKCAVFCKTKEKFGGLSNMASGFPLVINGTHVRTSEALYQLCRFPKRPDVQKLIIQEASPMAAKMRSKPYRKYTRFDWDETRVLIMRWALSVKLIQNWRKFGNLLNSTGTMPIVEESKKDNFWGAKPTTEDILIGQNILGRLLMELRLFYKQCLNLPIRPLPPPDIPDMLFLGEQIQTICPPITVCEKHHNDRSGQNSPIPIHQINLQLKT